MEEDTDRRRSIGSRRNPETEAAILAAAEALLIEKGPAGFSIEAVARAARAGKPTIYRWWPNRTRLLLDVYHRQKHVMPSPDTGSLHEDLVVFIDALLGFWRGPGGAIFRSVITEAQTDADAAQALRDYAKGRREHLSSMVERARERGEVTKDADGLRLAEQVSGMAWYRLLTNRLEVDRSDLEAIVGQLLGGVLAPRQDR